MDTMGRLVPLGRSIFGIGLMAFGIEQFVFGYFVAGRAPAWPASVPGGLAWAYASGTFLIAAGAAILSGRQVRRAAMLVAAMVFGWAFLRHLPLVAADSSVGGAWTSAGKALTLFTGALAVAGSVPAGAGGGNGPLARILRAEDGFVTAARFGFGVFLALAGIQHFLFTQFVATLVPAWIPAPYFWTYFAAIALIAGGIGLFLRPTAQWAALMTGLMIFIWFVILHVPRAVTMDSENEWIAVVEAFTFSGVAFVVAGYLHARARQPVAVAAGL